MNKEFQHFLNENYSNPDLTKWNRWILKFVEPAFDKSRHGEMIRNFGYAQLESHDFKEQYEIYDQLKNEERLDEETKKFIGFLAGNGFFKKWNISLMEWFNMNNWIHPYWDSLKRKTINELLEYKNGLKCFKIELLEMPIWRR